MRTTITLDDAVFENARKLAADAGITLSGLIEAALRDHLTRPTAPAQTDGFRLITFGAGGLQPGYAWDHLEAQVADDVDLQGR